MSDRDNNIIKAALTLFYRFGMAKTTMNDIANEAGLSRQSVYAAFASKEDLLRAATRHVADQTITEMQSRFAETSTLADKLDIVFDCIAARHFAMLRKSPGAEDLFRGSNAACKNEQTEAAQRYRALIAEQLQVYGASIRTAGLDVEQLAEYIQRTTKALKYEASDEVHLKSLWQTQRTLLLQLLAPAEQA